MDERSQRDAMIYDDNCNEGHNICMRKDIYLSTSCFFCLQRNAIDK